MGLIAPINPRKGGDLALKERGKRWRAQEGVRAFRERRRDGEEGREKKREGQSESGDTTVQSCVGTGRCGKNDTEEVTSGLNAEEWVGYTRAVYLKTTVRCHLTPIMIATTKKSLK